MGRSNTIEGVEAVGAYVRFEPHADALLTIYTVGVSEDDMADVLSRIDKVLPGQATLCPKGESHSLANRGDSDLLFFAVVTSV